MNDRLAQDVLILNDDNGLTRLMLEVLAGRAIRGTVVRSKAAARKKLAARRWGLLVAELELSENEELRFVSTVKEDDPELPVVLVSGEDSAHQAVKAMRLGCRDVLVKPVARGAFEELIDCVFPNHDVPLAAGAEADDSCPYQIAGRSARLLTTLQLARKVAPTSVPVLITGESGTGKELISYYIHRQSHRLRAPYVRVNCAALSESLLESELFGHERGAFTGAYTQRKGRFELAHGGTLLLDEVSETGRRLQAELLRVLEQQDFERVGGSESVRVNVRVVSTSNRDLAAEVERGNFRLDLYYRICGVHLHVPPLRDRPEDIPPLVWYFVNQYARESHRRIDQLDPEMVNRFKEYHWPGNVRQLRNVVRTALILGRGTTLSLAGAGHLLRELRSPASPNMPSLSLQELERQAVLEALRRTDSHQVRAAKLLGITDRTLREKIRKYRQKGFLSPKGSERWQRQPV